MHGAARDRSVVAFLTPLSEKKEDRIVVFDYLFSVWNHTLLFGERSTLTTTVTGAGRAVVMAVENIAIPLCAFPLASQCETRRAPCPLLHLPEKLK